MPSRIVKGHSRYVVLQNTKKTRDGKIFYLATLSPESALALQAALNDMLLELEVIEQQNRRTTD